MYTHTHTNKNYFMKLLLCLCICVCTYMHMYTFTGLHCKLYFCGSQKAFGKFQLFGVHNLFAIGIDYINTSPRTLYTVKNLLKSPKSCCLCGLYLSIFTLLDTKLKNLTNSFKITRNLLHVRIVTCF